MKPTLFKFWVVDQPSLATVVGRKWLAHALRTYRKPLYRGPGDHVRRGKRLHCYTLVYGCSVILIEPADVR